MKSIIRIILTAVFLAWCSQGCIWAQKAMFVKISANNPDIFYMPDVDNPGVVTQLTFNGAIDNHPDFHEMGGGVTMVVWSSNRAPGDNFEIYKGTLPDLDASAVRLTFSNYPDRHPHLSHDGMWIVCTGKYRWEPSVVCPKSECSVPVNTPCGWFEGLHIIDVTTGVISEIDLRNMPITGGGVWPNSFATWTGHPSFSPDNSKIIFSAAVDEGGTDWEVYTMDWTPPNIVSNLTRVTQGTLYPDPPNPIQMSAGAEFASDGAAILYSSTRTSTGNSQIYKIPANSVNIPVNPLNQMTWNYGNDYVPEELSDGRITFTSDLGPMICPPPAEGASTDLDVNMMNSNGSGRTNLTDNNAYDETLLLGDEVSWFCGMKPNLSECTYFPKTWNICWWREFYKMGTDQTYLPYFPKREQYTHAYIYVSNWLQSHDPGYWNALLQAMASYAPLCQQPGQNNGWLLAQSWWIIPSYFPSKWDDLLPPNPSLLNPPLGSFYVPPPAPASFFDVFFEVEIPTPPPDSYGFQIDDSPKFDSPEVSVSNLPGGTFTASLPVIPKLYFWRASYTNSQGTSWSTIYYFRVVPQNTIMWDGDISSDWTDPQNWKPYGLPGPGTNTIVERRPSSYDPIIPPGPVPIEIIALSLVSLNPMESPSLLGDERLSVSGTTKVTATIKGIPFKSTSLATFHYMSSPLTAAHASTFSGGLVNWYNEPTQMWMAVTDPSTPLEVTRGYSVAMPSTGEVTFTGGQLNSGDQAVSGLTYTPGGSPSYVGWHLRGNPFASAIKWGMGNWNRSNVDNAIYTYNGAQYVSYVPGVGGALLNGVISSLQAFMVHVSGSGAATLTIPEGSRLQSYQGIYKNATPDLLELKVSGNTFDDKTFIHFENDATEGFDPEYDAHKLFGIEEAPQLYSMITETNLSINSLPAADKNPVVSLGLKAGNPGQYMITASGIQSFANGAHIYLEDIIGQKTTLLNETPYYGFAANPGDAEHRFNLHFNSVGIPDGQSGSDNIKIYSSNKEVYVNITEAMKGDIRIYDILGNLISKTTAKGNSLNIINLPVATGWYVVKVTGDKGNKNMKVFIN